jgi:SAM-dependent methyltransferase
MDIVPTLRRYYGTHINFRQANIERIPFGDQTFDLLASSAVLEHVQNLEAMVRETARVLRSGGWAWHEFGPLYYSFGADHCIAAYGQSCGYDHLLLSEPAYQERINDQSFFDTNPDPNLAFWARRAQFSFAPAGDYITLFSTMFDIKQVVVKLGAEAIDFRAKYPEKWNALIQAGVPEHDLIIKSLGLVLQRK